MNSFDKDNLNHIKDIFEKKTGVELAARRPLRHPARIIVVLAIVIMAGLSMTAFAVSHFSSLAGDELGLSAVYEGDGIVSVSVENMSDKDLRFQPKLKLMRWNTSEEVEPLSKDVKFSNTKIAAHSSGVMTINLSKAYDIKMLETPLTDDNYYFVLTNNNFGFGQDWMCSVYFAEENEAPELPETPASDLQAAVDETVLKGIPERLRFYFETVSFEIEDRHAMEAEYIQAYTEMLAEFSGKVVPSTTPLLLVGDPADGVVFDDTVPPDEQYLLVGENWLSEDANFKLLAANGENALVLSAALPLTKYIDADTLMPLFYIFTYEKSAISSEKDSAFIYGRLMSFAELESYKVYEDDQYACYEVSSLIYSDLADYTQSFVTQNGTLRYDEQIWNRVENIYDYYKENMGKLFYYK